VFLNLKRIMDSKKGIFSVYKPKGLSSFRLIEKIRNIAGEKRVGHGGTLDPLAEGVLVVAVGRENTRKLEEVVKKEKEYLTVIKLGVESSTDDEEGEKTNIQVNNVPKEDFIINTINNFLGEIEQIPPRFSAVKVKGRRAYKLAREGKDFELKPRKVFVKEIEIIDYKYPFLKLKVVTGKGFYVRSLARDIGKELGTGGYVLELKRTRVGNFTLESSIPIDKLEKIYRE